MERVICKCRKNTHALLLLMAALLFARMSDNVNVAAASRKMKIEDVDANNDDSSPVPAAPPSEPEPAPAPAPAPEPAPAPAPAPEPAPAPAPAPEPAPQPATTTVTFFMHDVVGGPNPTAKPLSISAGSSTYGLIPPVTSAGSLLNLPFQNRGPLPLTFPSTAIPQSPLFNGQFPVSSINSNGFVSPSNPSFFNGVGPSIPAATGAGLLNPLLQNGPVLPLTFPNGFVPSSSANPLLNGIGINGQNLQFNQFPAALNFPFTSQQGIPFTNSPNLLNPLPNSPFPGAGTLGAAPLPLNQQGLGISSSEVIVIEDPLTEGPDESSARMGKGVGYYMASPKDPKILLMTFTAKFEEESEYEGSTIELSGEDNTALAEREMAVVGGSGKFEGAKGHAVIETVSNTANETVLKFIVNLTD